MEDRSNQEQSTKIEGGEAAVIQLSRVSSLEKAGGLWCSLRPFYEGCIHFMLFVCASISILVTVGIVVVLLYESVQFFYDVPILEFLTGTRWSPLLKPQHFGILPLLCGTMLVAGGSAIVAVPIGLGTAIYLSEYASPRFRDIVKPMLEILAGIPSVVFGYLAIVFVSPIIREIFPSAGVFNAASACIVVGIMILPMIISLSEDILQSVPLSLRAAAFALGANKFEVTVRVIVPAALSGIMASFLLAISRAIGETMAVTLAAGATPKLTLNPLESIQTMTAYIVQVSQGDTPTGTLEYRTIFAVGLALFITTMVMNVIAQYILSRVGERYE
ncbi:phosphate ABC transporter permease subunit PstC [Gimesia sp.]|uniref:phosphate ABC transporter permease subunit PstC n=1 Tax=Gimesia sp. TaxID=2024833 RepID=UPI000C375C11|nr:phosphate ABC transporter permease subunit PstC [Gimesia sp.]MAX38836.1 phosphate ABC transporter permease subunit PstC [Gimesia sp.]HBL43515.1 phosphate ABC transporter permease subunit PstC [Planctomycetaceae bacterium]|tara:strand:+ start:3634 stop:4626 length:993 start_codon:yes stop_codon:yes gene_type:complete